MATPSILGGPAAWHGRDLMLERDWIRPLSPVALSELDDAVTALHRRPAVLQDLKRGDFAFTRLAIELAEAADELENGRGVVKLTGVPVERYDDADLRRLFWGLGLNLGTPVYQNAHGEVMGLICDEGAEVGAKRGQMVDRDGGTFLSSRARAQSTQLLRWHTDRTDVVGLLCAGEAAEGGTSRVASAVAIHDEMVRRRPDLAAVLYDDIMRSRLGEEAGGVDATYALPVFGVHEGRFSSHYSRTYVEAAQNLAGVPTMRDDQWAALDLLAELGEEMCFEMELKKGDIQFLNNHVIYHARGAFRDDPAAGQIRRLYRLWLAMPNSRELPPGYDVLFGSREAGAIRGGILQADDGRRAPM
ncbi:MAG: TauD/TfdA family dioxygenase [Pseudomonadota bacterium]